MMNVNTNTQTSEFKNRGWFGRNWGQILLHVVLWVLMFFTLAPLFLLIVDSLKTNSNFQMDPFGFPSKLAWENYELAWLYVKDFMLNSVVITVSVTVLLVLIATVTAYAFTRMNFRFKEVLFMAMLALMMVPGMLNVISQYGMINKFNLINDYMGVILPSVTGSIPYSVFLFRTFFSGIPKDLFEAAEIDGASHIHMLFLVMVPLAKPIIATLVISTVMGQWNDYLWPLLVLTHDLMKTIPIGLVSWTDTYFAMTGGYGAPFAAYVISSIPLVVIFSLCSKQFIAGLTSGALKM